MSQLSDIDVNFKVGKKLDKEGIKFYDALEAPFKIYGVFKENGKFRRIPEDVANSVSNGVSYLHLNTAGGRVRFKTDSSYVAISAVMTNVGKMSHFTFTGSAGFDLYADNVYSGSFVPPIDIEDGFESLVDLKTNKLREITVNFPLYSGVCELYIGLDEKAVITEAEPYINENPIVYYGSSITQGGCASRPGNCYQNIIARHFNCDYINLGFSGSAKAEDEIIDYIKNLDMSVFVYDYDHNAPSLEHLNNTHEKMFKEIRKNHPDMPVIIMSRPKNILTEEESKRREIIETTYKNAISSGDKNVYFLDGNQLTALCGNEGTVDNCHPNDFGFASIAKALVDVLSKVKL